MCVWDGFKLSFSATRSERARKRNNLLLEPIHLGTEPAGIGKEDEEEEGGGVEELDMGYLLLSEMRQLLLINLLSVTVRYITFRKWPFSI